VEYLKRPTPAKQQGGQKPSNNPPKASGTKPEATTPKSGAAATSSKR
jgi:hypothetical protein